MLQQNRGLMSPHIQFFLQPLKSLQKVLTSKNNTTFVMGDFNQRIPKKYSRQDVYDLMLETFQDFNIATQFFQLFFY